MLRIWKTLALAAVLAGNTLAVGAQEQRDRRPAAPPPPAISEDELFVTPSGPDGSWQTDGDTFVFVSSEMAFGGKVVKGAPYSAQAVTESVQTLADGNRIVHKNSASVYRDSEGRTRRDQSLSHFGPFATAGDAAQTSYINDPVARVNYILDPRTRTARKLPVFEFHFRDEGAGSADSQDKTKRRMRIEERVRVEEGEAGGGHGFVFQAPGPPPGAGGPGDMIFVGRSGKLETKTEKLERRAVEGVEAEGERVTTTIPAGELGNEQPIQIVHERWYSPELQVVVMTRHSDPRFGETTYRLTNINRSEPAPSLFQLPGDYTLKEMPSPPRGPRRMRLRTPAPPQEN